jgi:hypothetical protein
MRRQTLDDVHAAARRTSNASRKAISASLQRTRPHAIHPAIASHQYHATVSRFLHFHHALRAQYVSTIPEMVALETWLLTVLGYASKLEIRGEFVMDFGWLVQIALYTGGWNRQFRRCSLLKE